MRRARSEPTRHVAVPAGLAPRRVAVDILDKILNGGATYDAAASDHRTAKALGDLSARDRGLAHNIVATSLRRLPQIEAVLAAFLHKPIDQRSGQVRAILVSGTAQILFLASPPHAVVNIATALAGGARSGRGLKGLVNAVLRRVAGEGPAIVDAQDAPSMVLPDWLRSRWERAYGASATRAIAELQLAEPPLDLTVPADAHAWAERLGGTLLPSGTVRIAKAGPIESLPGYADGAWWVQDAAAAVPVRLLGDVAGIRVVDLCAAPGGKTAQLAVAGAIVTAVDRDPKRVARLATNLERLGLEATCEVADATAWRPATPVDAVIVDAPCTATGTIRRHPDILLRRRPEHLAQLVALQSRLLDAAVEMIRPGGVIVYCACSLEPEEGEEQIARLIRSGAPVNRSPIAATAVPAFADAVNQAGELRILPIALAELGGNDGFFAARLNKA